MEEGNLAWDGVGEKFEWKAICQSSPGGGVRWWGLEVEVVFCLCGIMVSPYS